MDVLHYRTLWLTIGWLGVGLLIYLSLTPLDHHVLTFAGGDVIEHIAAYGVVTAWFGQIYTSIKARQMIAVLLIVASPVLKLLQQAIGHFPYFEYGDVASSIAGVIAGLLVLKTPLGGALAWMDSRFPSGR